MPKDTGSIESIKLTNYVTNKDWKEFIKEGDIVMNIGYDGWNYKKK